MVPKLMQECSGNCKEQCEFTVLITIIKLTLMDKDKNRGFEDIALTLTIDSNVIKIDNIQSLDENVNIKREICFQTTPLDFSKKLQKSPIMINLARECMDLGTVKLRIFDCFSEFIMCDGISTERLFDDYTFEKDGMENATMEISFEVAQKSVDNDGIKDFLRANAKRRERMKNKGNTVFLNDDSSLGSEDTISSFTCDADLLKKLCPLEDKKFHSFSTKSQQSKASKCLSDIATSLDINKCSNVQKTFCRGCRGFSISGLTCDNKMRTLKTVPVDNQNIKKKNSQLFIRPINRICSECFTDLSILPGNTVCPKCSCLKKSQVIGNPQKLNTNIVSSRIKIPSRDVVNVKKNACPKELQIDPEVKCKSRTKQKEKVHGKNSILTRCTKVKRINKASKSGKKGLRVKHYGVVMGHRNCQESDSIVPKNMGWLWNTEIPGITCIRRGWKPGAVPKSVARMMKYFLVTKSEPPVEDRSIEKSLEKLDTPSLHVEKKLAEYKITLNPLSNKSHGEDASPIVFNISKYDDTSLRLNARKMLKQRGVTKTCKCRNICECSCIDDSCRNRLLYELETISQVMKINPPMKYEELTESECGEIDFKFTPPFTMMNKCKRDVRVSVAATQYEEPLLEKFEETEESSEHDIVVKKRKFKKSVKSKSSKDNKKIPNSSISRGKPSENLRELKTKECCVSYCKPNLDAFRCEISDRSTTNYNPLYPRCLPNYSVCPPSDNNCQLNSCFNVMN